jgi:hypothetical protein
MSPTIDSGHPRTGMPLVNSSNGALAAPHRGPTLVAWQLSDIATIALLGPPAASLVLFVLDYFEYWRAVAFSLPDFLVAFFLFAFPVGYAFGVVPALTAGSLYCAVLRANSRLFQQGRLIRACVAAICGGSASWVWFVEWLGVDSPVYELASALVMTALTLASPPSDEAARERTDRSLGSGRVSIRLRVLARLVSHAFIGATALLPDRGGSSPTSLDQGV